MAWADLALPPEQTAAVRGATGDLWASQRYVEDYRCVGEWASGHDYSMCLSRVLHVAS
jgi:hypothetical protein